MVPGRILGCSCCDGEETSGSENKKRLESWTAWAGGG
jgi:hypothetical protein